MEEKKGEGYRLWKEYGRNKRISPQSNYISWWDECLPNHKFVFSVFSDNHYKHEGATTLSVEWQVANPSMNTDNRVHLDWNYYTATWLTTSTLTQGFHDSLTMPLSVLVVCAAWVNYCFLLLANNHAYVSFHWAESGSKCLLPPIRMSLFPQGQLIPFLELRF